MKTIGKIVAVLALCGAAGIAAADGDSGDSSMNPYTGDSWAALQGGGHNLGEPRGMVTVRVSKARHDKTIAATADKADKADTPARDADAAARANLARRDKTT